MEAIAWNWQSIDGAMHKAPLATECVGPNPTDRGKKWTQTKPVGRRNWGPAIARRQRRKHTWRKTVGDHAGPARDRDAGPSWAVQSLCRCGLQGRTRIQRRRCTEL